MSKLSLRGRVLVIFSAIMIAMVCVGGTVLVSNARQAVRAEINASKELAKKLTLTAISSLARSGNPNTILSDLPLHLQSPRHVRMTVLNMRDEEVSGQGISPLNRSGGSEMAPRWFDALIRPPAEIIRVPVVYRRLPLGFVVITTEPSDEIAEVWDDLQSLFYLMLGAYALLLVAIYWALGRALAPLRTISHGLERLEHGDYKARLPTISVPDLQQIGFRFNALAGTLQTTTKEKEALSQQLITVQDTERKNIALELHDEFGPCLFGIKVDANSIKSEAEKKGGEDGKYVERAEAILDIVDHMQEHNRALLYRLRPMALGHFGLSHLLDDLTNGYRMRNGDISWSLKVDEDIVSCGETVDLTIYRVVQECLTNAVRHAEPSEVRVTVERSDATLANSDADTSPSETWVHIQVTDDGRGLDTNFAPGFGLTGMRQRVYALGGEFSISTNTSGGTVVDVLLPVEGFSEPISSPTSTLETRAEPHV